MSNSVYCLTNRAIKPRFLNDNKPIEALISTHIGSFQYIYENDELDSRSKGRIERAKVLVQENKASFFVEQYTGHQEFEFQPVYKTKQNFDGYYDEYSTQFEPVGVLVKVKGKYKIVTDKCNIENARRYQELDALHKGHFHKWVNDTKLTTSNFLDIMAKKDDESEGLHFRGMLNLSCGVSPDIKEKFTQILLGQAA